MVSLFLKGISRGPEALQSHLNEFYHTSVLRGHGGVLYTTGLSHGKHNTILYQESFWGLCNAFGPLDIALRPSIGWIWVILREMMG